MKEFLSFSITTLQSYPRKQFKLTPETDSSSTTIEDIVLWFSREFVVPSLLLPLKKNATTIRSDAILYEFLRPLVFFFEYCFFDL